MKIIKALLVGVSLILGASAFANPANCNSNSWGNASILLDQLK